MMRNWVAGKWSAGARWALLPCLVLALAVSMAPLRASADGTNGADSGYVPWGDPAWTTNDFVYYVWPDWMVSALRSGGEWQADPSAWHVPASDTNDAFLQIDVDRSILSNNVLMRTWYMDTTGATLYVDLINTNETVVVTNFLGFNLLTGSGTTSVSDVTIPFGERSDAVGIRLHRGEGEVTVYGSLLVPEASTNVISGDSGNETNAPTSATLRGTAYYGGTQGGTINVIAVTNAEAWDSPWKTTLANPGAYEIANLPIGGTYWIKAYVDASANGSNDTWEAKGTGLPAPLFLLSATNVDVVLTDPDSNGDGLSDWAAMQLGFDPQVSNVCSRLPFAEMFETNTVHLGDVGGQNGWMTTVANTVLVQTGNVYAGQQALALNAAAVPAVPASTRHVFAAPGAPLVWIDYRMLVQPGVPVTNTAQAVCSLYFNADGRLVVLDGLRPVGQQWVTLTNQTPLTIDSWARITLRVDYAAQRWMVCLNGLKVADGLGFATPCAELHMVKLEGGIKGFVDNFSITASEPDGTSMEGSQVSDNWLMRYFGNLEQTDAADPDQDGLTNLQEYQLGLDPTNPDTNADGILDGDSVSWGLAPLATNVFAATPWSTGFEASEGYAPGMLLGQNGWVVPSGAATVEQDDVFADSQALRLSPIGSNAPVAGVFLLPLTNQVVWSDLRLKMSAGSLPSVQLPGLTAIFCVGPDGKWAGRDGSVWQSNSNSLIAASGWVHATIRHDFGARRWDLYVGATKVFSNLAFSDPTVDHFTRLAIVGGGSSDTCLDQLNVGTSVPGWIDMDGDGLTNDQEAQYGTDPLNPSTAGNGMDDGTAVRLGLNPLASNAVVRLDSTSGTDAWATGFEPSEGYVTGELGGQNGWSASGGVQVVSTISHTGVQGVVIPGSDAGSPRTMSLDVALQGRASEWLSFYAQVQQGVPDTNAFAGPAALKFYVSCNRVFAYDGILGDWRVSVPMNVSTNWTRFDVGVDNARQKYQIYVNGVLALNEINFADASCLLPGRFDVIGSAVTNQSTCVDDLRISATMPTTPATWYVDASLGSDGNNGTTATGTTGPASGPKRTIAAALMLAVPNDVLSVADGNYAEPVNLGGVGMITPGTGVVDVR